MKPRERPKRLVDQACKQRHLPWSKWGTPEDPNRVTGSRPYGPVVPLPGGGFYASAYPVTEPPNEEHVEQVSTEILAWRAWGLDGQDAEPLLRSITFRDFVWPGPTVTAHESPERDDPNAGIHAVKDRDSHWLSNAPVSGQVALHGRVVVGTEGYRAEKATIRSLTLRGDTWGGWQDRYCALELASILEERYCVDVVYDPTELTGGCPTPASLNTLWDKRQPGLLKGIVRQQMAAQQQAFLGAAPQQHVFGWSANELTMELDDPG
jgi:hypothetical protein